MEGDWALPMHLTSVPKLKQLLAKATHDWALDRSALATTLPQSGSTWDPHGDFVVAALAATSHEESRGKSPREPPPPKRNPEISLEVPPQKDEGTLAGWFHQLLAQYE